MPSKARHTALPLDLPVVSRGALQHINTTARKREPWHGSLGDESVSITTDDSHTLWQEEDIWCGLRLSMNGAEIVAFVPFNIVQSQLTQIDDTLNLETLDADSSGMLAEALFEPYIQSLEEELNATITCTGIDFASEYPDGDLIGLRVETDSWGTQPLILLPTPAWGKRLHSWIDSFPVKPKDLDAIPTAISFRVGLAVLTLDDLINLRPGDGIILDENSVTQKSVIAVVGESFAQTCMVTTKGLELTAPLLTPTNGNLKGWTFMSDYDGSYPGGSSNEPGAVGQVNVKLVFEVGRQDLTVKDLQEIDTGHVFDLGRPVGQAVDILAGGRQIGAGELVRVGDQIGVRVDWILK